jgi:FKBP-type peptidyl-prolyl cis-trans isomerase SlyD
MIEMSEDRLIVADNMVVSMAYVLQIGDDQEVDRADKEEPLSYIHGQGQIIPGLEKELYGLALGDKKNVEVKPSEGYGEKRTEDIVEVDRNNFPPDFEIAVGRPVSVKNRDTGEEFLAYIHEISTETVSLDFNHPLAGETLQFSVEIVGLRDATEQELSHGHVHTKGADH